MAGGSDHMTVAAGGKPGKERLRTMQMQSPFAADGKGEPYEIVDAWVARLIQRPIDSEKRRVLVESLGEKPTDESVKKMVQLIVSTPDYQLC